MWNRHKQQQQRGVQFRPQGNAPSDAIKDRSAQDHEHAVVAVSPPREPGAGVAADAPQAGEYPASRMQDGHSDPATGLRTGGTPFAPDSRAEWDQVVQPEQQGTDRKAEDDDLPLPEGK